MEPQEVKKLIEDAGGKVNKMARLPDGSGFATASFPLPKGHWLTQETEKFEPPPMPFRMGTDDPRRKEWLEKIKAAGRFAVRAATMNGKIDDFDPDAMVQNFIIGMLGYFTPTGLSNDVWANPKCNSQSSEA